jgi:hypothetical protein
MRNHHPDLNNRLRSLRIELAEALVPIHGPLPPGIVKMFTELKASTPRSDPVRNDGVPLNSKASRANVVHREVYKFL